MCLSKFLIFMVSELLDAKIEESKTNSIPNHIYIYIYIPLHILEIYGLKKCKLMSCII